MNSVDDTVWWQEHKEHRNNYLCGENSNWKVVIPTALSQPPKSNVRKSFGYKSKEVKNTYSQFSMHKLLHSQRTNSLSSFTRLTLFYWCMKGCDWSKLVGKYKQLAFFMDYQPFAGYLNGEKTFQIVRISSKVMIYWYSYY